MILYIVKDVKITQSKFFTDNIREDETDRADSSTE